MASPYVRPVPLSARARRLDHGIDYQGVPGQSVVAIGDARVDAVKSDPRGFGVAVYYTLMSGPHAGQQIYVGHAQPTVKAGQVVKAGDAVATLLQKPLGSAKTPGWVEIGLAANGVPAFPEGEGGRRFRDFLASAQSAPDAPADTTTTTAAADAGGGLPTVAPTSAVPTTATGLAAPAPAALPLAGGTDFSIAPRNVGESWQALAALPDLSPDTQRFIQLSGGAGG